MEILLLHLSLYVIDQMKPSHWGKKTNTWNIG